MNRGPSPASQEKLYGFSMETIDGKQKSLGDYRGHPVLIVNVASRCGYTPQYKGLEELHRRYKEKGLRIAGFPANEFGAQEPGTDAEIKQFCSRNYDVTFDMYSKIVVKGPGIHPLYDFLTHDPGVSGEVQWNFSKFLADKSGKIVARFEPDVEPLAPGLVKKIESVL